MADTTPQIDSTEAPADINEYKTLVLIVGGAEKGIVAWLRELATDIETGRSEDNCIGTVSDTDPYTEYDYELRAGKYFEGDFPSLIGNYLHYLYCDEVIGSLEHHLERAAEYFKEHPERLQ